MKPVSDINRPMAFGQLNILVVGLLYVQDAIGRVFIVVVVKFSSHLFIRWATHTTIVQKMQKMQAFENWFQNVVF